MCWGVWQGGGGALQCMLCAGSIPEKDQENEKLYNTCTVFGPDGDMAGQVQKGA